MSVLLSNMSRADYLFELGYSRTISGDFLGSIRLLEESAVLYLSQQKYSKYMNAISILLDIAKELKDVRKIEELREELMNVAWEHKTDVTLRAQNALAITSMFCNEFDRAEMELQTATEQIEKMLSQTKEKKSVIGVIEVRFESLRVLHTKATYCVHTADYDKADEILDEMDRIVASIDKYKRSNHEVSSESSPEEVSKIRSFLQEIEDVKSSVYYSSRLIKAIILRERKQFTEAEQVLWDFYDQVQSKKNQRLIVSFFYYIGMNYVDLKDYGRAQIFLNLAKRSVDTDNYKDLHERITDYCKEIEQLSSSQFDLIVDFSTNCIIEKSKGRINFKNQFILLDLLKMFVQAPGVSHSKEDMVTSVWNQQYDPIVHDNKIYVTIKRLRELIEPDCHRPKYLFRGKEGYYINGNAKILFKDNEPALSKINHPASHLYQPSQDQEINL